MASGRTIAGERVHKTCTRHKTKYRVREGGQLFEPDSRTADQILAARVTRIPAVTSNRGRRLRF